MLKQVTKRGVLLLVAIALLSVVVSIQCFSEPEQPPGEWYPNFENPWQCLKNLVYTYDRYQSDPDVVDKYKEVLDPEYVFYFDPDDVGSLVGQYVIPVFWTYEEDWTATQNMFNQAYSITFEIPILNSQDAETFGIPDGDQFTKNNVSISLLLMVDEVNGYIAQGFCDFTFAKNAAGQWHLIEWKDFTAA